MVSILADQNFDHRILRGLKRSLPGLNVVTAQELGMQKASDYELLTIAAQSNRVIVTHDIQTFPHITKQKMRRGEKMSGVIVVPDRMPIGKAIEKLIFVISRRFENEWENNVSYLRIK